MPRYELSEGTSNKFWDINLSGKSFTTTYGKIGANGQTTIKQFANDAAAKKEYEKLIGEKTKKGYQLVGKAAKAGKPTAKAANAKGTPAAGVPAKSTKKSAAPEPEAGQAKGDARNPELEKAILANPFDREAYAVFADWLQEQGDPRGELISLQLGNRDGAAKKLIQSQAAYFLGDLAEHQKVYDSNGNNNVSHLRTNEQHKAWEKVADQAFLWRNGYIYRCRLSYDEDSTDEPFDAELKDLLSAVLAHPSGRYIVEFAFQTNGSSNDDDLQPLIDVLAKSAPATTRKLVLGDNVDQISWHHTGNLGKLWRGVPNLQVLEIETGEFEVGKMVAPNLERAIFITGGLSKSCGKNIATADMPKVKHLEIYYGTKNYGGSCSVKEVKPLLDRTDLKQLEYLGLKNSEFADDIAKAVVDSKLVKQLKVLDLSLGTMTDAGAAILAANKDKLKHLELLDLHRNYLTKQGIKAVAGLCKKVVTTGQEQADEDGDDVYRYPDITE
ncbi:MAG TPA: WGR domain-containing protein [Kofleriaceae bacterium]